MELIQIMLNGQITIPIQVIKKLNIKEGDKIMFIENDNAVQIVNSSEHEIRDTKSTKKYVTQVDGVQKEFLTGKDYREYLERIYGKLDGSESEEPSKKTGTHEEFMEAMIELAGAINDPTFIEPPEIEYESPREEII